MTTYKNYTAKDITDKKRESFKLTVIYLIKYQTRLGDIIQEGFNSFDEYYDRLKELRNKATNILDYGAVGE